MMSSSSWKISWIQSSSTTIEAFEFETGSGTLGQFKEEGVKEMSVFESGIR